MKFAIILFMAGASCLPGQEAKPIDATVGRVPGTRGEISFRIDYRTAHEAKLGVNRGMILQQRLVSFYDNGALVGSYFYFRDVGSLLPSSITEKDLQAKPKAFTEIRAKDYFYDINWHDGHASETELGKWFSQTWHLFNSCDPNNHRYYLCPIDDIPRMDGFLKGSGFTVHEVLTHGFTIPVGKDHDPGRSPEKLNKGNKSHST